MIETRFFNCCRVKGLSSGWLPFSMKTKFWSAMARQMCKRKIFNSGASFRITKSSIKMLSVIFFLMVSIWLKCHVDIISITRVNWLVSVWGQPWHLMGKFNSTKFPMELIGNPDVRLSDWEMLNISRTVNGRNTGTKFSRNV